ncbi:MULTISPECIES: hypothetical protein [unclassified Micromonospora]|uniref:hypothetical protein n=1 Tax=unclassified Micromonospora TaxID=2617518 RepID=UPI0010527551|nr:MULTISPECIES: hypothetical protein [unclassified Micromonospora]TDC33113.1 hypothetical protein E1166_26030 [Micromonospora sp. KC213]TDC82421.1 hypothetical protein E1193_11770 [Micromonospora sp. KC606]
MTSPWSNPPQLPTGPRVDDDPTGLYYDRNDVDEQPTTTGTPPASVDGWAINGRAAITVQLKPCCGDVLVGEYCDCAEFMAGLDLAPVVPLPAFPLRELAEQHITAVEWDRRRQVAS